MSTGTGTVEQQSAFTRQAAILRKNVSEWDAMLNNPRGEDWPSMVGRLSAALNQTASMDRNIDDVLEHFVYVPRKVTANPQDIPFFLSTRLEMPSETSKPGTEKSAPQVDPALSEDPVQQLTKFEKNAARLAADYEDNMVRF